MKISWFFGLGLLLTFASCRAGVSGGDSKTSAPINLDLRTMGGMQFWTDVRHRSGWRIQRYCVSGHFRLVDAGNVRRAWGSLQQCEAELTSRTQSIPANRGTVLIVAHGLGRTTGCWGVLAQHVQEQTNWQVIRFAYASTRKPVEDHAAALGQLIQTLGPEVHTIHMVGHSLGNIVLRHYFGDTKQNIDPRWGRLVMIGPPNLGSRMARVLYPTLLFPLLTGSSGYALGWGWDGLKGQLAVPSCEFGIVAGGDPAGGQGWNPILRGPSDGTVSLAEAWLPGASDVMVQPLLHSTMMKHPEVCSSVLKFLRTGEFRDAFDSGRPAMGSRSHRSQF